MRKLPEVQEDSILAYRIYTHSHITEQSTFSSVDLDSDQRL